MRESMIRPTAPLWIFLLILVLFIQTGATFSTSFETVFQDDQFLTESVFQLCATDLDNDGQSEALLSGKNYTGREVFVYWLKPGTDGKPQVEWQSENLFEDLSPLWIGYGKFTADEHQFLALSNTQAYFYQYRPDSGKPGPVLKVEHDLKPLNMTNGDLDGDGRDELVIARVGKITAQNYQAFLQIWRFDEAGRMTLVAESNLIGNIRGIGAGDLDGDGRSELLVDEGTRFASGNIHLLRLENQTLVESYSLKKALKGAVYAMIVAKFPEGNRLVTASTDGQLTFFAWQDGQLVPAGRSLSFQDELVAVAALNNNSSTNPLLWVSGNHQHLKIIRVQARD